jgi:hypothetical protein
MLVSKTVAVSVASVVGVGIGSLLVNIFGVDLGVDPAKIVQDLSEVSQSKVAQNGLFFILAAWIHSGRVKTEISKHFTALTSSIDSLGVALRQDLERQSKLLENHGDRLETLENTIKPKP